MNNVQMMGLILFFSLTACGSDEQSTVSRSANSASESASVVQEQAGNTDKKGAAQRGEEEITVTY